MERIPFNFQRPEGGYISKPCSNFLPYPVQIKSAYMEMALNTLHLRNSL